MKTYSAGVGVGGRDRGLRRLGLGLGASAALADGDAGRSAAEVTLSSHDLVVVAAQVQANLGPGIKVGRNGDGAADTLVPADRPVLLEGAGALDGWLVGSGADEDVVGAAVDSHLTLLLGTARGVVGAEVLNDVVLDERAASPTVNSQVAVTVGVVATRVRDGTRDMELVSFR